MDTYKFSDHSIGTNDFGKALYDIGGVQMTEAQAEENAHFFEADDDYEYDHNGYDQSYEDDTLPGPILNGLHRINNVLGGEGAADFLADELLGIGESRMSEVLAGTNLEKGENQSYANAVLIDMASEMGMREMHQINTSAVTGHYDEAMGRWDRLRTALRRTR